jgi:hypothetical protein
MSGEIVRIAARPIAVWVRSQFGSGAQAERRVNDVASRAKDNINRARNSAAILAFIAAAVALLGRPLR